MTMPNDAIAERDVLEQRDREDVLMLARLQRLERTLGKFEDEFDNEEWLGALRSIRALVEYWSAQLEDWMNRPGR